MDQPVEIVFKSRDQFTKVRILVQEYDGILASGMSHPQRSPNPTRSFMWNYGCGLSVPRLRI